jgi:hypothetical protein
MFGMGLPPVWHAAPHVPWTGTVDWVVLAVIATILVAYEVCAFFVLRKLHRDTTPSAEPKNELPETRLPKAA